jgi:hypothetical protein
LRGEYTDVPMTHDYDRLAAWFTADGTGSSNLNHNIYHDRCERTPDL